MEQTLLDKSLTELKLTLMCRSLVTKESRMLLTDPDEIIQLMQSSTEYLLKRSQFKPEENKQRAVRFTTLRTSELVETSEKYGIEVTDEYHGWKNEYEFLKLKAKEPVMVMVYLVKAIKLQPDYKQSHLNRCAAFFVERTAFEAACLKCIDAHKKQSQ
ncbi:hypothetical protein C9J21_19885 [Photobacterium phosphoreum]|nr:hypothetical protein C9J21_19885 [Photobacterium phosphoreum]